MNLIQPDLVGIHHFNLASLFTGENLFYESEFKDIRLILNSTLTNHDEKNPSCNSTYHFSAVWRSSIQYAHI